MEQMTYAGVGIDYETMDPFKRACMLRAERTNKNAERLNINFENWSRGESGQLSILSDNMKLHYLGLVEEGLGTKNLIADAMYKLTGKPFYHSIAIDTIGMIANDMITVGLLPALMAMHIAAGDSSWFKDEKRCRDLIEGWGEGCDIAGCVWSGGETPTLKDIIMPGTVLLSGSAMGISPGRLINPSDIRSGDAIVMLESSGIHANGLTMARKIAEGLPNGYMTMLPGGRTYGATLLVATEIYVPFIEDCLKEGIDIHYAVHITGHGWRKLMRAPQPFTYVIEELPRSQPIFDFIQKHGPVSDQEAYATFNMGAGFAVYLPAEQAPDAVFIAQTRSFDAFIAGRIDEGEKKVVIKPKNLVFEAETLGVR